ncbi:MAG TPA: DUF3784 domain-containing protein [Chloroflexi bacterium]|nr:DUF3784 domain-containing protein [Chloroflexota bacterium]
MHWINFGTAFFMFLIGAVIKYKKAAWLIAGYNTAPRKVKESYDLDRLTRMVGHLMYLLGGVWLAMAVLGFLFEEHFTAIMSAGTAVFIAVAVAGVIYLNTGNRLNKRSVQ